MGWFSKEVEKCDKVQAAHRSRVREYTSFVVLCEKKVLANPHDENSTRAILTQRLHGPARRGVVVGVRVQQDRRVGRRQFLVSKDKKERWGKRGEMASLEDVIVPAS